MNGPDTIVCKPTPWFLLRAGAMLLMFGIFAVLFYIDGTTGYRKKNEIYYLNKTFQAASADFAKMNGGGTLTAAEWERHAGARSVAFPADRSVLPAALELPMPWPPVLRDFGKMQSLQTNMLWREYTRDRGWDQTPPEHDYGADKIREQLVVFACCSALALFAGFILVRTLRRSISADDAAVLTQQGKRVPYAEMKTLDLRKWDTKGLAFIDHDGPAGKGRIRIDGLTYGGFKKDQDEPAERLMRKIRARFSGEIIEYATEPGGDSKDSETGPV